MSNGSSFKLEPNPKIKKPEKPLLVVVLDGWGEMEDDEYNAISRADTPCMDSLKKGKPDHWMLLKAHGTAVRTQALPSGRKADASRVHASLPGCSLLLGCNLGHAEHT